MVASLIEFATEEEIRGHWKAVFEAHLAGLAATVVINSSAQEGTAHAGIVLGTPEQRMNFIRACQAALRAMGAYEALEATTPSVRFDLSPVRV